MNRATSQLGRRPAETTGAEDVGGLGLWSAHLGQAEGPGLNRGSGMPWDDLGFESEAVIPRQGPGRTELERETLTTDDLRVPRQARG